MDRNRSELTAALVGEHEIGDGNFILLQAEEEVKWRKRARSPIIHTLRRYVGRWCDRGPSGIA